MEALHFKFIHPSKQQLSQLVSRHFYCPGFQDIINSISDNCHQCNSLKILPKILLQESSQPLQCFRSSLAVDVMERQSQKILIMVEQLSDQTAPTLMDTMISMAASFTPLTGTTIRSDNAPAFVSISNEATYPQSSFAKLNLKMDLGRVHNPNKNPLAEIKIRELEKELLRHDPTILKILQIR